VAKFGQFLLLMMATLSMHFQAALLGEVRNPLGTLCPKDGQCGYITKKTNTLHSFFKISEFSLVSQKGDVLLLHLIYVSPATKHKDISLTQTLFQGPFSPHLPARKEARKKLKQSTRLPHSNRSPFLLTTSQT
jgi:hypothetical protein